MKAIFTKAYGAHRIKATDNDCSTVVTDRDLGHAGAVRALCERINWHGTLAAGDVLRAGVFVGRVYVWIERQSELGGTVPNNTENTLTV